MESDDYTNIRQNLWQKLLWNEKKILYNNKRVNQPRRYYNKKCSSTESKAPKDKKQLLTVKGRIDS